MKITNFINYKRDMVLPSKTPPYNNFSKYNNINLNATNSLFNNQLKKDTVCFTSTISKPDYKDLMYKAWYERTDKNSFFVYPETRFHTIEGYNEALNSFDVKNFIALGGESAVFELNDGNILKLSSEKYPPYLEEYHAPEIDRNSIKLSKKYTARDKSLRSFETDEIYYVIQKKGTHVTNGTQGEELYNKAKKAGLNATDFHTSQFAYFDTQNGKEVRCIDLGCITPKDYPMKRDFEAVDKMAPYDVCTPYSKLFFTLKKHLGDKFNNNDEINAFIQTNTPRIKAGESILDIIDEQLINN